VHEQDSRALAGGGRVKGEIAFEHGFALFVVDDLRLDLRGRLAGCAQCACEKYRGGRDNARRGQCCHDSAVN
jgi:hypothetical protein